MLLSLHKNTNEPLSLEAVLQCPIAHLVEAATEHSVANPINVAVPLPASLNAPADILKGMRVAPVVPVVP